jgi:hypothetical protein
MSCFDDHDGFAVVIAVRAPECFQLRQRSSRLAFKMA